MDTIAGFGTFLAYIWSMFTQTIVPGTSISFADLYEGAFVVLLSIKIFHYLMRQDLYSQKKGGKQ